MRYQTAQPNDRNWTMAASQPSAAVRGIYGQIRQDIISLRLRPGTRLSENELALRFGTSRAPVREAIIRLVEEGLIEVLPQRGSFVTRISLSAMERARFVREALEVAVVRRAAERGLPSDTMEQVAAAIITQENACDDTERFTLADDAFHRLIAESIGVAQIWAVLEREKSHLDRIRFLSLPAATPVNVLIAQHRRILEAITQRDMEAADRAMRTHLSEVLKIAAALAAEHPDLITKDD